MALSYPPPPFLTLSSLSSFKSPNLLQDGVAAIAKSLETNVGVVNIDLSFNDVGDVGATALGQMLVRVTFAIYFNVNSIV